MIDYIKILLLNINVERLLNLSFLDFKIEVSENTGLLSTKRTAEYHFCKISIYDTGVVLFTGSIHKLFNSLTGIKAPNYNNNNIDKGFNGNQFELKNIIEVRTQLEYLFECKPQQMLFQNIELGVNTTPGFNPRSYIKGLLYHNNKMFEYRYNGNLAQAEHQRFIIKIYNKSSQYGMSEFTLRIELKFTKTEDLKGIGIRTFADVNSLTIKKAEQLLLSRFDEVMHFDYTIKKKGLTKAQNLLLKCYSNPRYWINDLKPEHRDRHKKRLKEITNKFSKNLHHQLRQNIIQKCVIINRPIENSKCVIINSSSIGLYTTQSTCKKPYDKCLITGIDLKHESRGAKYIRSNTLNHLLRNDKNTFEKVCSYLLSTTKGNRPKFESNIISHLAKQVRNRYFNSSLIRETGYNQKKYNNQITLFNFSIIDKSRSLW